MIHVKARSIDELSAVAIRSMLSASGRYAGLLPSILDRTTRDIPAERPPRLEGQREHDRSFPGSNLLHDVDFLQVLYEIGSTGRPELVDAADCYLRRFAIHCTNTLTGLFPWGEHAFWDLRGDCIGNSSMRGLPVIHDHLREVPCWLWEKLYEFNPECVDRFADALDYHWKGGFRQPLEYQRHAFVSINAYAGQEGARSCDFPRHSGFYILDWAFAHSRFPRPLYLKQVKRMLEYWWIRRDKSIGLLPEESRTIPENRPELVSISQTLSLAVSLLHAEPLFASAAPHLASRLRRYASAYLQGCLSVHHNTGAGTMATKCHRSTREVAMVSSMWGSHYGVASSATLALLLLDAGDLTNNFEAINLAKDIAEAYIATRLPTDTDVHARNAADAITLWTRFQHRGLLDTRRVDLAILELTEKFFDHESGLPRASLHADWYEAQTGSSALVAAVARYAHASNGHGDRKPLAITAR